MTIPITWVDAFSEVACGGNPAAVCLLEEPLDESVMQSIAFELGISETAYLTRDGRAHQLRPPLVLAGDRDRPVRSRHAWPRPTPYAREAPSTGVPP